jgi:hypothetical protein
MKTFLIEKKHKPNELKPEGRPIQYSFSHLYKYYDTILFGVHRAKVALSDIFEMEIKGYLDSMKKEKMKAKKRGEVEEKEVDPISYELYRLLYKMAIARGNIFVWTFLDTQWPMHG